MRYVIMGDNWMGIANNLTIVQGHYNWSTIGEIDYQHVNLNLIEDIRQWWHLQTVVQKNIDLEAKLQNALKVRSRVIMKSMSLNWK